MTARFRRRKSWKALPDWLGSLLMSSEKSFVAIFAQVKLTSVSVRVIGILSPGTMTDTPKVALNTTSEVPGVTNSSIQCVNSSNSDVGNSPQGPADPVSVTANGLKPGTYTCTIVVDP